MALARSRQRQSETGFYWPGFVDAMAQLLLVITFLLSIFMIAQFMLAREITGQDTVLSRLRTQIAELTQLLSLERSEKSRLEINLAGLNEDLDAARNETARLQSLFDETEQLSETAAGRISGLQAELAKEQNLSSEALARIELLNQQIAALRRQINSLNEALEASEARDKDSKAQIADLGRRLNIALAARVAELARFRSEFFGRLRQILSQRDDIRIAGDRFVFQSEVLFDKGQAEINDAGGGEIAKLAQALAELTNEIPEDINWVLRVDGHTDSDPISSLRFASNWELSSARAIAVVKQLISLGIPPERLVAAGFGEFQPLDPTDSDAAKAKNRRIELKLTER